MGTGSATADPVATAFKGVPVNDGTVTGFEKNLMKRVTRSTTTFSETGT